MPTSDTEMLMQSHVEGTPQPGGHANIRATETNVGLSHGRMMPTHAKPRTHVPAYACGPCMLS